MKKNLLRLMACVLAFALMLSLAACGGKDDSKSKADDKSSAAPASSVAESKPESKPEEESSAAAAPASGKFASISEFLADPQVSSQLESMMSALGDSMDIDIAGDGSKLVYTFRFTEALEDPDSVKAAMEEQMSEESFASTFEGIAASLSDAIEVENPSVVVTYLDADGSELCSKEYFAN